MPKVLQKVQVARAAGVDQGNGIVCFFRFVTIKIPIGEISHNQLSRLDNGKEPIGYNPALGHPIIGSSVDIPTDFRKRQPSTAPASMESQRGCNSPGFEQVSASRKSLV